MDILRKKYKRGEIDPKTYREKMTELTILHLESINYQYIGKVADGTHGVVVELKSPNSCVKVATKIVMDEFATDGEMKLWSGLVNEHILPLIKWRSITETSTKAFFSLKYPETLNDKLQKSTFYNEFDNAVSCIKDITNGIQYLHQKGLCHLNLQTDHILLKYNNRARIGSFRYLTSADSKELKYGASAIYRPPETYHVTNEPINGQKFDVWSLGILAAEIATGQHLKKEISDLNVPPSNLCFQLYGKVYDMLEKETFRELVKKKYKNSSDMNGKIDQVLNFITSCLTLSSKDRPSVDDLLKHQLLGGETEKYYPEQSHDIWSKKVNPVDSIENVSISSDHNCFTEQVVESEHDIEPKNNSYISDEKSNLNNTNENEIIDEIFVISNKNIEMQTDGKKDILNTVPDTNNITEKENDISAETKTLTSAIIDSENEIFIDKVKNNDNFEILNERVISDSIIMNKEDNNQNNNSVSFDHDYKIFDNDVKLNEISSSDTDSEESIMQKVRRSPTKVTSNDDDELEPGEVPLFRKDYASVLRNASSDYSASSISLASNDEDLEEGEVDLNRQSSYFYTNPKQDRKRFRKIRSWWKRQKKNISTIFKACFPTKIIH